MDTWEDIQLPVGEPGHLRAQHLRGIQVARHAESHGGVETTVTLFRSAGGGYDLYEAVVPAAPSVPAVVPAGYPRPSAPTRLPRRWLRPVRGSRPSPATDRWRAGTYRLRHFDTELALCAAAPPDLIAAAFPDAGRDS